MKKMILICSLGLSPLLSFAQQERSGNEAPPKEIIEEQVTEEAGPEKVIVELPADVMVPGKEPLVVVDGKEMEFMQLIRIPGKYIARLDVLKAEDAGAKYGEKAENGVLEVALRPEAEQWFEENPNWDK